MITLCFCFFDLALELCCPIVVFSSHILVDLRGNIFVNMRCIDVQGVQVYLYSRNTNRTEHNQDVCKPSCVCVNAIFRSI